MRQPPEVSCPPPVPPQVGRHLGAPAEERSASLHVASPEVDLPEDRVVRNLDVREASTGELLRLLQEVARPFELAALVRAVAEALEEPRHATLVAELAVQGQALLVRLVAGLEAPKDMQGPATDAEDAGSQSRRKVVGRRQQLVECG